MKKILTLSLLCYSTLSALAQPRNEVGWPLITTYRSNEIGADPQSWAFVQDSRGVMYIGTTPGVMEFDGASWRMMPVANKTFARSLAIDEQGRIYVGAHGEFGYLAPDSVGELRYVSLLQYVKESERSFNYVWTTIVTPQGIYFQARERLFRFSKSATASEQKWQVKVWKPRGGFGYAFWRDGAYYVQQNDVGLMRMIDDSLHLLPGGEQFRDDRLQVMLPYASDGEKGGVEKYLVGTFNRGFFLFDGESFQPFKTEIDDFLRKSTLYDATVLPDGRYGLATITGGFVMMDRRGRALQYLNTNVGTPSNSILAVYADRQGTVWLAPEGGITLMETPSPLSLFDAASGLEGGVYFMRRHKGVLYVGGTNGIFYLDTESAIFKPVNGLEAGNPQTFHLLSVGAELLAGVSTGLYRIEGSRASVIIKSVGLSFSPQWLHRSKQDSNRIFVGLSSGLAALRRDRNGSGDWKIEAPIPGINSYIAFIVEPQPGELWLGTGANGTYRVRFNKPTLENPQIDHFDSRDGLPNDGGVAVFMAAGQAIFAMTDGLFRFDEAQQRFTPDSVLNVVSFGSSSSFSGVTEDHQGNIWVNFGRETALLQRQPNGSFRTEKTAFLRFADLPISNIYPEKNGVVWFGSTESLLRYDPTIQKDYTADYPALIRRVMVGQDSVIYGGAGNIPLNPPSKGDLQNSPLEEGLSGVSLPYRNNALRFEFSATSFDNPRETQYQFMLEGFDDHWSNWSKETKRDYTNLPEGDYRFHVRAKNIYQHISQEAVYEFTILPPWWRSWWAYGGYALMLGLLVFTADRLQRRRLIKKERQRAELLSQIGKDITASLDSDTIFYKLYENVNQMIDATIFGVGIYHPEQHQIEYRLAIEKGKRYAPYTRDTRDKNQFPVWCIENRQSIFINDVTQEYGRYITKYEEFQHTEKQGLLEDGTRPEEPQSLIYLPLIAKEKVLGIITIQSFRKNAYADYHLNILQNLAAYTTIALDNSNAYRQLNAILENLEKTVQERTAELQQKVNELAIINSVQQGLASKLEMQAIYDLIGDKIREIFDAQVVDIAIYDSDANLLRFPYTIERGVRFADEPMQLIGYRRHVMQTRQPVMINKNIEEENAKYGNPTVISGEPPKSVLFVPLVVGEEAKGVISLQNVDRENAFTDSDLHLLQTLANSMSVALENAHLFDETNRLLKETEARAAELAIINSVGEGLAQQLDFQAIIDLVGDKICEVFKAQVVSVSLYDPKTTQIHHRYAIERGERFYFDKAQACDPDRLEIIQTRKPLVFGTSEEMIERTGEEVIAGEFPKSWMGVPIILGQEATGVITVQDIEREHHFSESDVRLLETLASNMGVALENARLFDETKRLLKESEQRNAELAVINSVQEGLVAQMDMQGIYDLVGEKIRTIFNAQVFDIVTYDREANLIEDRYAFEKGDTTRLGPRPPSGFRKHVISTRQPLVINQNMEQAGREYDNQVVIGEASKSCVFVPMIAGGEVTGIVSLQNLDQDNAFPDSDVRLLTTLANSMSVALENARLFDETNRLLKETEQRNAELAVINSVQEGLVAQMDMQGIYDLVGDKVRDIFDAQAVLIATFDHEADLECFHYLFEKGARFHLEPRPIAGIRRHLIRMRQLVLINENYEQAMVEFGGPRVIPGTELPKSLLFVPLIVGDTVKGYVSLQNIDREHAFSDSDVRLLTTLANSMSVALENARLFDETNRLLKETEQRNAELAVINSVQEGLVAQMDMQGIYDLVGDKIREIFNAQVIDIVTYDREVNLIEDRYSFEKGDRTLVGPRPPSGFRKHVISTRQPLVINQNMGQAGREYDNQVVIGEASKSCVFVPMIAGGEVTGIVSLQNLDQENAFPDSDVRLLTTLANSMSVALENARLFDETNRLLKETETGKKNVELLSEMGKEITASLDFETIFYKLYEHVNQLTDATIFGVGIYNSDKQHIEYKFAIEKGKRYAPYTRDTRDKNQFPVWCIENRQTVFVNDVNRDYSRYISEYTDPRRLLEDGTYSEAAQSLIYLPLISQERVMGVITIQSFQKNAYTEYHLNLLRNLATYTSIALDNANAYRRLTEREREIRQRAAELATVNSISQALASKLEVDALIKLVGEKMRELFKAEIVYVALLDKETNQIKFPYGYGEDFTPMLLGEGLTSKIIQTGESLLINEDVEKRTTQLGVENIGAPAASYLGVPIPVGNEYIGAISVQSTEQENRFTEADLRLLATIAANVGVALHNARLFEEIKQARAAAEEANEAKSTFLSTVSHELRTPLTSVIGFSQIVKKRLEERIFPVTQTDDPKIKRAIKQVSENLDVVVSEGERLTKLINDLLDLAKIEAGKYEWRQEPVEVPDIIERASAATSSLFESKGLKFVKKIEGDLPELVGDRDKLIQVVINLLSNSVKFTDKGSVTCRAKRMNGEIVVSVIDTGLGIAKKDQPKVFEKFKQVGDTLTDKPKGTGLGLPICKEIVEHHGGRIWVESKPGKGSTFSFTLPIQTETRPLDLDALVKQLKARVVTSAANSGNGQQTILVVDDEANIRELLNQEFSEAGYRVRLAENGRDALAKIREAKPDLVILDVMMPEMNGFDLAAVLKNDPETMEIPIIILSIVQDKERGFRLGVDRYLTKPINTEILFNEVDSLLAQGKSKRKVMVVDEDASTVKTLVEVLQARGYHVVEANGPELIEKAVTEKPDIIILNSLLSEQQEIVKSLRFEKGLENVLFLVYQ